MPEPDASTDPLFLPPEADAMVQELLDVIETHPDGPMQALLDRLGRDDTQPDP